MFHFRYDYFNPSAEGGETEDSMRKRKVFICILILALTIHQSIMSTYTLVSANQIPLPAATDDGVYSAETVYDSYMKEYPNCIHGVEDWKKVNGKYQYPVTSYDAEWQNYPHVQEKYVACHIPDEIIQELSTEELLELVLDFPLLINIYAYSSYDEGVKEVAKQFNGMAELLKRTDCLSVVSSYYQAYKIPKQQQLDYDALLPENPSGEDYAVIVNNEENMKKADEDTKVNEIINFCEAVMEIASEENRLSTEEQNKITNIILKKGAEKAKSDCITSCSIETTKSDSLLNTWTQKTVLSKAPIAYTVNNTSDTKGVLYSPSGAPVWYVQHTAWSNISASDVSSFLKKYDGISFTNNGDDAVTCMQNGTTKYDCFNYAWLYHYDKYKYLWKQCDFDNDNGFRNDTYYDRTSSPAATLVVGSNGIHAVIVTTKKRKYKDSNGNVHEEPLVKSKWGTTGPLMKHPLSLCPHNTSGMSYYC